MCYHDWSRNMRKISMESSFLFFGSAGGTARPAVQRNAVQGLFYVVSREKDQSSYRWRVWLQVSVGSRTLWDSREWSSRLLRFRFARFLLPSTNCISTLHMASSTQLICIKMFQTGGSKNGMGKLLAEFFMIYKIWFTRRFERKLTYKDASPRDSAPPFRTLPCECFPSWISFTPNNFMLLCCPRNSRALLGTLSPVCRRLLFCEELHSSFPNR